MPPKASPRFWRSVRRAGWIGEELMEFDVEIVLRETNQAVTQRIALAAEPRAWAEPDVESVLKQILLAIDRVKNPADSAQHVALRGFSWIVEPLGDQVVIAIEIPMGAAVAGPFDIDQVRLDQMIRRVIAAAAPPGATIH
jgi:hypothetical protein